MTLYQKILSVVGALRASIGLKASRTELANAFDPSVEYQEGRLVVYEGHLYRCVGGHYGAWNDNDFVLSTVDAAIRADSGSADIPVPSDDTPLVDSGIGDPGESETYSRSDHVHPTDATRQPLIEVSGVLKGSGSGVDVAASGVDYVAPGSIAPDFSESAGYAIGDLVWRQGILYRCTAAHSAGSWDVSHFGLATVSAAISASGGSGPSVNQNYAIVDLSNQTGDLNLQNRTVHKLWTSAGKTLILPSAEQGMTADLVVDVLNQLSDSINLTIRSTDFAQAEISLIVPKGAVLSDMCVMERTELARYYFTLTAFSLSGKPTWMVVKRIVDLVDSGG